MRCVAASHMHCDMFAPRLLAVAGGRTTCDIAASHAGLVMHMCSVQVTLVGIDTCCWLRDPVGTDGHGIL